MNKAIIILGLAGTISLVSCDESGEGTERRPGAPATTRATPGPEAGAPTTEDRPMAPRTDPTDTAVQGTTPGTTAGPGAADPEMPEPPPPRETDPRDGEAGTTAGPDQNTTGGAEAR
ncbi:hypothetical protein RCC89_13785 [Cytophagaceae bacterium ABcell3]|nr:hypothetical protein RCC89_13785 [Cytophagaceae bacterium ABcell3]